MLRGRDANSSACGGLADLCQKISNTSRFSLKAFTERVFPARIAEAQCDWPRLYGESDAGHHKRIGEKHFDTHGHKMLGRSGRKVSQEFRRRRRRRGYCGETRSRNRCWRGSLRIWQYRFVSQMVRFNYSRRRGPPLLTII